MNRTVLLAFTLLIAACVSAPPPQTAYQRPAPIQQAPPVTYTYVTPDPEPTRQEPADAAAVDAYNLCLSLAYGFDKMVGERVLSDIGDYCDAQAEPLRAPE